KEEEMKKFSLILLSLMFLNGFGCRTLYVDGTAMAPWHWGDQGSGIVVYNNTPYNLRIISSIVSMTVPPKKSVKIYQSSIVLYEGGSISFIVTTDNSDVVPTTFSWNWYNNGYYHRFSSVIISIDGNRRLVASSSY
ncbi:MAG: hypothetical protein ACP5IC_01240, partial [Minisyncoccia bacterium]